MTDVPDKSCRENQNTHLMLINFTLSVFFENLALYEIMWNCTVQPERPHMTIWRLRIACWIPNATNTQRICNTYWYSTAIIVARTCDNVTSYVHCPVVLVHVCSLFVIVRTSNCRDFALRGSQKKWDCKRSLIPAKLRSSSLGQCFWHYASRTQRASWTAYMGSEDFFSNGEF
jgi:hypothetical protein